MKRRSFLKMLGLGSAGAVVGAKLPVDRQNKEDKPRAKPAKGHEPSQEWRMLNEGVPRYVRPKITMHSGCTSGVHITYQGSNDIVKNDWEDL